MKPLNAHELCDGFPLVYVVVEFDTKVGLFITERSVKVVNRVNVAPATGCDCIIDWSSVNSKSIFEIGGIDGVIGIDTITFSLKSYLKVKLCTYCLHENVDTVKTELVEEIKVGVAQFVREQAESSAKMLSMLANCD